ncbi:LuxR C-terminal-related transcriptional regulator [Myroides phaeus]|uniref:LuxR C-terminal-related transcriptional regulator n=1 Tax=Myroides phaeus TaxID=702745 RepID=UPI001302F894|nr:LuxR C-terminal-related transcriptional regulator [Myroides phaeus]
MKSPLQKKVASYILLLLLFPLFSYSQKSNSDITFFENLQYSPLAGKNNTEISKKINNYKWLRITLENNEINKPCIFKFPSAHILDYDFYVNDGVNWNKIIPNYDLDGSRISTRFPEHHFKSHTPYIYLKIPHNFNNAEQFVLKERGAYKGAGVSMLILIGVYYGFIILSILLDLGFYYISKDQTFIIFSLLLASIGLIFFHEDGMFYFLSDGKYTLKHIITLSFPIISFLLSYFTYNFLSLKESGKIIKLILTTLALTSILLAISYTITDQYLYLHILKHACLIIPIIGFLISLSAIKKDIYMKILTGIFVILVFQVLGYSWSITYDIFNFSFFHLNALRITMSISIVAINILILMRIEKLNRQNQMYRNQIKNYIFELKQQKLEAAISHKNNPSFFIQSPLQADNLLTNIEKIIMQLKEEFALTDRETDVLVGIWEGLANQEIAENLSISLSTTKHHVSNLYAKLNVKNRSQTILLKESLLNQQETLVDV